MQYVVTLQEGLYTQVLQLAASLEGAIDFSNQLVGELIDEAEAEENCLQVQATTSRPCPLLAGEKFKKLLVLEKTISKEGWWFTTQVERRELLVSVLAYESAQASASAASSWIRRDRSVRSNIPVAQTNFNHVIAELQARAKKHD